MDGPTDFDAIAAHYAANTDERAWNALYERPAILSLLRDLFSTLAVPPVE